MAPIVATGSGVPPQILDDLALRLLLENLKELPGETENMSALEDLTVLLDPWKDEWLFEEQVRCFDCHELFVLRVFTRC